MFVCRSYLLRSRAERIDPHQERVDRMKISVQIGHIDWRKHYV
jgi:hypothetical protein